MSSPMEHLLARAIIEQRMRESNQQHLAREAREARRSEQPSPAATPARKTPRFSRFWGLVHVRRATS